MHKSHARETSLFTGPIPNQVCNSQTPRFVSVPGQNPGRSSRGDSMGLRLESGLWRTCHGSGVASGYDSLMCSVVSREWNVTEESASGGEVKLRGWLGG